MWIRFEVTGETLIIGSSSSSDSSLISKVVFGLFLVFLGLDGLWEEFEGLWADDEELVGITVGCNAGVLLEPTCWASSRLTSDSSREPVT